MFFLHRFKYSSIIDYIFGLALERNCNIMIILNVRTSLTIRPLGSDAVSRRNSRRVHGKLAYNIGAVKILRSDVSSETIAFRLAS